MRGGGACHLFREGGVQAVAIFVFEFLRSEGSGQGLDQFDGEVALAGNHQGGIGVEFRFLTDFVLMEQGVPDDSVAAGAEENDLVAPMQNELGDGGLAGLSEGIEQERVRLFALLIGRDVVGVFQINGIDFG